MRNITDEVVTVFASRMVIFRCFLLMLLSFGSAFVLMPKNATGRVAGDLTLLKRYAYRWDMPEESTLALAHALSPSPCRSPWPSSSSSLSLTAPHMHMSYTSTCFLLTYLTHRALRATRGSGAASSVDSKPREPLVEAGYHSREVERWD